MPNFLDNFGLESFNEDEDSLMGLLGHVVKEGKGINGYYGIPYLNTHLGDVQVIARIKRNNEGNYECCGFDTHCKGRSVWDVRIVDELNPLDDDPLCKRLFLKSVDGDCPFIANIVNADVLPSFSKDEIIKLQMIAFSDKINFFENDDDYRATVDPGLNGAKITIGDDTIFPAGLFSKDDDPTAKDIVHIHGTVDQAFWGRLDLGQPENEDLRTFIICRVKTHQYGDIEIVESADAIDPDNSKHIHPGAIADCLAYLSGDPAIFELDEGIVKNEENNLKLVAYTLEKGDPERLRSVLADGFVYHSENANKHIENIDEYIELVKHIHKDGVPCRAYHATISEHQEENLEYPIGTKCLVLKYEDEEGYNSIVFVDQDESGNIQRILISKDARYRFKDDLPPSGSEKVKDVFSGDQPSTEEAIFARADIFRVFSRNTSLDFVQKTLTKNKDRFIEALSPILNKEEIGKSDFGTAFFRGVELSKITDYDDAEVHEIGELFYTDALHHVNGDNQKEVFSEALPFVMTLGYLYEGRADDHSQEGHAKYLRVEEIKQALAEHLIKHRGYSEEEAEVAVHDFPDPYSNPYLREDFIDTVEVDGIEYEKNADCVDLTVCGIDNVPRFCFYTLYRVDDIPNHKVGEYRDARKLFQAENLDPNDFPSEGEE